MYQSENEPDQASGLLFLETNNPVIVVDKQQRPNGVLPQSQNKQAIVKRHQKWLLVHLIDLLQENLDEADNFLKNRLRGQNRELIRMDPRTR